MYQAFKIRQRIENTITLWYNRKEDIVLTQEVNNLIVKIGTMYTTVNFCGDTLLRESVHAAVHNTVERGGMGVKVDGAFHSRAYKGGFWDGITDFYDTKEDRFHTGLLQQFLTSIRELQKKNPAITYEIEDTRPAPIVHHDAIDEEIVLGNGDEEPIILREKQYEAVKFALKESVSIINGATNFGKTEVASGIMQQLLPYLARGERIAFFCNSREIFHQSAKRIAKRLNIPESRLGKIGDGKMDIKNKQIVFVMVPTLASALKDPKKGVKFTAKERVIKMIAEEIVPKFKNTVNTRQLIRNYIKNCKLDTAVWHSVEEHLMYVAYDNKFTDKSAQMHLNKYVIEFDKIMEKKNKNKYKKYKDVLDFMDSVRVAIQDEAHEINGETVFNTLIRLPNAQYRVALTGTVDKRNQMLWQRMQSVYSSSLLKVSNDYLISNGFSSKPLIRMVPIKEPKNIELVNNYLEAYKLGIVENDYRNKVIAGIVKWFTQNKEGGVLVSVNHIDHGERIKALLQSLSIDCEFTHGGLDLELREDYLNRFSKKETRVLIASSILDQGVDVKSIAMLLMAGGNKSLRQNLQRIGRGLRLNGIDNNTVYVFDFIDQTHSYLYQHSKERMKIYKNEQFDIKMLER